jgi:hypothetical protein
MTINPISVAVKKLLIETLEKLEVSYDSNFKDAKKELEEAHFDKKEILIKNFEDDLTYWQLEYAKINKIKRIIQEVPELDDGESVYVNTEIFLPIPAPETEKKISYKVTVKNENVTIYEKEEQKDVTSQAVDPTDLIWIRMMRDHIESKRCP